MALTVIQKGLDTARGLPIGIQVIGGAFGIGALSGLAAVAAPVGAVEPQGSVVSAGTSRIGASESRKKIDCVQVEELPQLSVAVQVRTMRF